MNYIPVTYFFVYRAKNMARHLLQNYSLQWAIAILKPTWFFTESTRFFH